MADLSNCQSTVNEFMTGMVVCFNTARTFRETKICKKQHRFAGTRISDAGELQGSKSIHAIIKDLDQERMNEPPSLSMVRSVVTSTRSNLFGKLRHERLPVVMLNTPFDKTFLNPSCRDVREGLKLRGFP